MGDYPKRVAVSQPKTDGEPVHPLVRVAGWVRLGLMKELSDPARDVLLVMACFASKEGTAFPAASTIAGLTGRSRTRIFDAIRLLKAGEVIRMKGRVKRRGSEAWGPTMYLLLEPPPQEKFNDVLVHRLRTVRWPNGVPRRRTSTSSRDAEGRLLRASRPPTGYGGCPPTEDGGRPPTGYGARPPTEDKDRDVPEGENLKGRREGEGVQREGEQAREAPLRSALTGSAPPRAPEEEAGREEEQSIQRLQEQIEQFPVARRQVVAQHLVLKGYSVELVERALLRAGNGNG